MGTSGSGARIGLDLTRKAPSPIPRGLQVVRSGVVRGGCWAYEVETAAPRPARAHSWQQGQRHRIPPSPNEESVGHRAGGRRYRARRKPEPGAGGWISLAVAVGERRA